MCLRETGISLCSSAYPASNARLESLARTISSFMAIEAGLMEENEFVNGEIKIERNRFVKLRETVCMKMEKIAVLYYNNRYFVDV